MDAIKDENGIVVGMVGKSGSDSSNAHKKQAKENITHMMNGGICVYGKYNRKVFQGENGNFYIEKDEENPSKGVTIFTNLFCKLSIA